MTKRAPTWTRDEIILATDLYFRVDCRVPDSTDPLVVEVCELINTLPLDTDVEQIGPRRLPSSVEMKISNIRAADPSRSGGHSRGNKLDGMFWTELGGDHHLLSQLAQSIALTAESPLLQKVANEPINDDMFAIEGGVLLRLHRVLERDSAIVRRKKSRILAEKGRLDCEKCRFNFEDTYGELGRGFIECHHTLPLSQIKHTHVTSLNDLMLVCSNCHRMFHRGRPFELLTPTRSCRPSIIS